MAGDDIIQRIVVTAEDQATPVFATATKSIAALGNTAAEALSSAAAAAQKFGASAAELQKVEGVIRALGARAKDSTVAFSQLAAAYDNARSGASQAAAAVTQLTASAGLSRGTITGLAQVLTELGLGPLAQVGRALGGVAGHLGVLTAIPVAFAAMALSAADTAEAITRMQQVAGGSSESISGLSLTMQSFGATAKEVEHAVTSMAEHIADAMQQAASESEKASERAATAADKLRALDRADEDAALQQRELNYERRKQLYGEDVSAAEKAQLARDKIGAREQKLNDDFIKRWHERSKIEHDAAVQGANDIQKLVDGWGKFGQISFDVLTKTENKVKALWLAMGQGKTAEEQVLIFLGLFDRMTDRAEAFRLATKMGFAALVQGLDEGESALDRYKKRLQELHDAGLILTNDQIRDLNRLKEAWNFLLTVLSAAKDKLGALIAPELTVTINNTTTDILNLGKAIAWLGEQFDWLDQKTGGWLSTIGNSPDPMGKLVSYISGPVRSALAWLGEFFGRLPAAVDAAIAQVGEIFNRFAQFCTNVFNYVAKIIIDAFNSILSPVKAVMDKIVGWLRAAIVAAKDLWSALKGVASGGLIGGDILPAAGGGLISGPGTETSDSILARLSAGEYVVRAAAVSHFGAGVFHALNNLTVPRFAVGGLNTGIPRLSAPSPVLAMSNQRVLTLNIEGRSFSGLSIPEHTAASLERFAVHSQIASTGRKQSWRR